MHLRNKKNAICIKSFYIGLLYQLVYPNSVNGMKTSLMQEDITKQQAAEILSTLRNLSQQGRHNEITNELARLNEEFSNNAIKALNEAVLNIKKQAKEKLEETEARTKVTFGWQGELDRLIDDDKGKIFETFRMNYEEVNQYWENLQSEDPYEKYFNAIQADVSSDKDLQHAFFKHFFHPFLVLPIVKNVVSNNKDHNLQTNRKLFSQKLDLTLQQNEIYQIIKERISRTGNSGYPCKIFDLPMIAIRTSFWRELSQYLDPKNLEHCFYFSALITYWLISNFKNLTGMICIHTPHSNGNNNPPLLSFNFFTHETVPCVGNSCNDTYNSHIFFVLHKGETFATIYPLSPQETDNKLDKSVLITVYPKDTTTTDFYVNISGNSVADIVYNDFYRLNANITSNFKRTGTFPLHQPRSIHNQQTKEKFANNFTKNNVVYPLSSKDEKSSDSPIEKPSQTVLPTTHTKNCPVGTDGSQIEATKLEQEIKRRQEQEERRILDGFSKNIDKIAKQLRKLKVFQKTEEIKKYIQNPFSIIPPDGLEPKTRYEMILVKGKELLKLGQQVTTAEPQTGTPFVNSTVNIEDKNSLPSISNEDKSTHQMVENPLEENNVPDLFNNLEEINLKLNREKIKTINEWILTVFSESTESGEIFPRLFDNVLRYICDIAEKISALEPSQNNSKKKSKKQYGSEKSKTNEIIAMVANINKQHSQCHQELKEIEQTNPIFLRDYPELAILLSNVKSMGESILTFPKICEQISEINQQIAPLYENAKTKLANNEMGKEIIGNLAKISNFIKDREKLNLLKELVSTSTADEMRIFDYLEKMPDLRKGDILQGMKTYNLHYFNTLEPPSFKEIEKILEEDALENSQEEYDLETEPLINEEYANFFSYHFIKVFNALTVFKGIADLCEISKSLANMLYGIEVYCKIFNLAQTEPKQSLYSVMENIGNDQMLKVVAGWAKKTNGEYKILEAAQYITLNYIIASTFGNHVNPIERQTPVKKDKSPLTLLNIIPRDEIKTIVNSDIVISNAFFTKYKGLFPLLFGPEINSIAQVSADFHKCNFLELAVHFLEPCFLLQLLELGADPNQLSVNEQETPLQLTISKVHADKDKKNLRQVRSIFQILINRGAFYWNPQDPQTKKNFFSDSSEIPLVEITENYELFSFFFPLIKSDENLKQNLLSIHMEKTKKIYDEGNKELPDFVKTAFETFVKHNEKFDENKDHMSLFTYLLWRSVETLTTPCNCNAIFRDLLTSFDLLKFYENGFKDHLFVGRLIELAALQLASVTDPSFLENQNNLDFLAARGGVASYIKQYASRYIRMKDDSPNQTSLHTVIQYANFFIKSDSISEETKIELVDSFPNLHTLIGYTKNDKYQKELSLLLDEYINWTSDPNISDSIKEKLKRNTEKL